MRKSKILTHLEQPRNLELPPKVMALFRLLGIDPNGEVYERVLSEKLQALINQADYPNSQIQSYYGRIINSVADIINPEKNLRPVRIINTPTKNAGADIFVSLFIAYAKRQGIKVIATENHIAEIFRNNNKIALNKLPRRKLVEDLLPSAKERDVSPIVKGLREVFSEGSLEKITTFVNSLDLTDYYLLISYLEGLKITLSNKPRSILGNIDYYGREPLQSAIANKPTKSQRMRLINALNRLMKNNNLQI